MSNKELFDLIICSWHSWPINVFEMTQKEKNKREAGRQNKKRQRLTSNVVLQHRGHEVEVGVSETGELLQTTMSISHHHSVHGICGQTTVPLQCLT